MSDYFKTRQGPGPALKEAAIEYFQANSDLYIERYLIEARGDVLRDRHRAVLQMLHEMKLPQGSRILDLGCGPGLLSFDLAKQGYRGVGLDAAPEMIQRCQLQAAAEGTSQAWQYLVGDVEAVPFQNRSFDAVICSGVIEYLPTDENMLREVARVLRTGGRFVLSVTNKYGYTVSLSSILDRVKRIPGVVKTASILRNILVGGKYGVMNFTFLPRKLRPSAVRQMMTKHGFQIQKDRYIQFTLLPAPFCTLTSKLKLRIDEALNVLDRTPLRIFGSCYLVSTRREE